MADCLPGFSEPLERISSTLSGIPPSQNEICTPFMNSLLSKRHITSLIRDADADERWLFTVEGQRGPKAAADQVKDLADDDIAEILLAIKRINSLYPSEAVSNKVDELTLQYETLTKSITQLELALEHPSRGDTGVESDIDALSAQINGLETELQMRFK